MKKILFLLLSAILITGCASTRKNGCQYGEPRKSYKAPFRGFLTIVLLLLLSATISAQERRRKPQGDPMNIQVEVDSILQRTAYNIDLRGLTLPDSSGIRDTVFYKMGKHPQQYQGNSKGKLADHLCLQVRSERRMGNTPHKAEPINRS